MLAISDLLEELRLAGVQLWLQDGRLRYRPAGALDGERLAVLRERRTVLPIVEDYPRRRSHHYADALDDVRIKALNLSHFLGLDRRLPDTSSRDLARVLWKTIDQFMETAKELEPMRRRSDEHARNVAAAFGRRSHQPTTVPSPTTAT